MLMRSIPTIGLLQIDEKHNVSALLKILIMIINILMFTLKIAVVNMIYTSLNL